MVRAVLEGSGIPSVLKNENICHTAGAGFGVALGFAWPEVWLLNNEDMQSTAECLKQSGLSFLKGKE